MWPRLGASKLVSRWLIATLVLSLLAAVDGGHVASWAALAPDRVWRGELWRLVTWMLVESHPVSLLLTLAAIYRLGGELAARWGDRRLRRFVAEIVIATGLATCLLGTLPGAYVFRLGGWAVADLLVIAWARQFPERTLVLYGLVHLDGQRLVAVTIGIAIVFAVYFGPIAMAPELAACAAAAAYPPGRLRR